MHSIGNILFDLGVYFRIQTCEKFIKIISIKCYVVFFVDRYREFKKFIIDVFADIKHVKKKMLLFLRRIQTVLIHPEFHANTILLLQYLRLRIHPTSKEMGFPLRRSYKDE